MRRQAYFNLGALYGRKGMLDEAIEEFRRALEITPDRAETHINLGVAYYNKGVRKEAIQEFEEALRIGPENKLLEEMLFKARIEEELE